MKRPRPLRFWIALGVFIVAMGYILSRICYAGVSLISTGTALSKAEYKACNMEQFAMGEDGGYSIFVKSLKKADGSIVNCPSNGYIRTSVLNHQSVLNYGQSLCLSPLDEGLTINTVDVDWIEVSCADLLFDADLHDTIGTGDGIYIEPMIIVPGQKYTYFAQHGNGALAFEEVTDLPVAWVHNFTELTYVDSTHVMLEDEVVELSMTPFIPLSTLTATDCWPEPEEGKTYSFRSRTGDLIIQTYTTGKVGLVGVPNGTDFRVNKIDQDLIYASNVMTGDVILLSDEVACRP
ncbi:hypothetical protein KBC80_03685 [Candidatus Woesebacteria bacterium]|nr:hypothetical protein [Candidatus Woesebacteria bacterium]